MSAISTWIAAHPKIAMALATLLGLIIEAVLGPAGAVGTEVPVP